MSRAPLLEDALEPPFVFIGAHPDDVALTSAVLILRNAADSYIVDVSSGAIERADYYPNKAGFLNSEEYALARQTAELRSAEILGLSSAHVEFLNFPDSELYDYYHEAKDALFEILEKIMPGTLFSHCFEGGHPDHDVVHFLARDIASELGVGFWEFPSYHMAWGKRKYQEFPNLVNPVFQVFPTESERAVKQRAVEAFNYTHLIGRFPLHEIFRLAAPKEIVGALNYNHIDVLRTDPRDVETALRTKNYQKVYS